MIKTIPVNKWFYRQDSLTRFWRFSPDPGKVALYIEQNRTLFDAELRLRYGTIKGKNTNE
jgi:hypothetical protein